MNYDTEGILHSMAFSCNCWLIGPPFFISKRKGHTGDTDSGTSLQIILYKIMFEQQAQIYIKATGYSPLNGVQCCYK